MRPTLSLVRVAVVFVLALTILSGVVFPAVLWSVAHLVFRDQANGSLVVRDGRVIGSSVIGQPFGGAGYFHPRPSAAGSGYDAMASGGSNLGPTNPKLFEAIRDLAAAYRAENGIADSAWIPADAVTRSASGLDPHISVENARLQATRIARERGLTPDALRALIDTHTEPRSLGLFGEPGVNVLLLNLALDSVAANAARSGR